MGSAEKMRDKKDFYENNSIQSIKSELLNNNTTISASASAKVLFSGVEQNFSAIANSYEDDDYNNDNIDVETDSDNDQQLTELKQMSYHNMGEPTVKHEEWSKIVKSSMLKAKSVERLNAMANDTPSPYSHPNQHAEKICSTNETKIDCVEPSLEKCSSHLKRALLPEDEESEFYSDSFTSNSLLNLSEKKRGRYGSGRGFSIENLIGRMVEDR